MGVAELRDQPWYYIAVGLFGFGCGLTFDEFALWLNLRDVYWEKEGRRSIDAVIVVGVARPARRDRLRRLGRIG